MKIRIVYTGRSYQTADLLPNEITVPEDAGLNMALEVIQQALPGGEALPASCLVAVGSEHLGTVANHTDRKLSEGDELVLIAPVAGG